VDLVGGSKTWFKGLLSTAQTFKQALLLNVLHRQDLLAEPKFLECPAI
jgi:hypothetical protein